MNKSPRSSLALEMICFSLPLMMSGVLQQLYSWADAFIIGHAELSGSFYLLSRLRSVDRAAERAGRHGRYHAVQRHRRRRAGAAHCAFLPASPVFRRQNHRAGRGLHMGSDAARLRSAHGCQAQANHGKMIAFRLYTKQSGLPLPSRKSSPSLCITRNTIS